MFRLMQRLFFYVVCHFGGGFSDYWWKSFSAFLTRWWHRLIYVSHRGFIYTDDLLFIFERDCAALFAALIVVSGDVLGVRWSYLEFEFGEQVKWIGLLWNFSWWATLLPTDKIEKATAFLEQLLNHRKLERRAVQSGASFTLWIAGELEELRPWVAPFFQMSSSMGLTLQSAPGETLAEIAASLDSFLVAASDIPQGSAKRGWKLLAVGSATVYCQSDLAALRQGRNQRSWLKWGDRESKMVATTADAQMAAKRWLRALAGTGKVRSLLPKPWLRVTCAADAQATHSQVGYGGWMAFRIATSTEPIKEHECIWFQEGVPRRIFPQEFGLGDNMQKHITCFETLAQTGLVFAAQFGPNVAQCDVIIPSLDDLTQRVGNQPSVHDVAAAVLLHSGASCSRI